MGLRCLMGHDFGELQTDRDRRERGDEVVVTIREYRACDRCGQTRVVSENKEVRRATPAASTEDDDTDTVESADGPDVGAELDDVAAEEDDGVILEDEPDPASPREPGAWPERDEPEDVAESSEPAPWPEVEGEDEGFAAEPSDGAPLEGVQFESGLTPEASTTDAGDGAVSDAGGEVVESSSGGDRGGIRTARPRPPSGGRQRIEGVETEFFCPECEQTTPTENSSLRPGDICPNCRLGYLTEREQ